MGWESQDKTAGRLLNILRNRGKCVGATKKLQEPQRSVKCMHVDALETFIFFT